MLSMKLNYIKKIHISVYFKTNRKINFMALIRSNEQCPIDH